MSAHYCPRPQYQTECPLGIFRKVSMMGSITIDQRIQRAGTLTKDPVI